MKKFSFFSRPDEDPNDTSTAYRPREPVLTPVPRPIPQKDAPARQQNLRRDPRHEPDRPAHRAAQAQAEHAERERSAQRAAPEALPDAYADLVQHFQRVVADRKSPYNSLVKAAERLREFIPNETNRLQAALSICGDQWPADALSLAVNAHIADIERARKKMQSTAHLYAAERADDMRAEAADLERQNAKLAQEIQALSERLGALQSQLHANRGRLDTLNQQLQLAGNSASAAGFVDQAAENLKNDLLAKKAILGLP